MRKAFTRKTFLKAFLLFKHQTRARVDESNSVNKFVLLLNLNRLISHNGDRVKLD